MPGGPLTASPGGGVDFSVNFENVLFGMLPAIFALIIVLAIACLKWPPRALYSYEQSRSKWAETMLLVPLVVLHLASLVVNCKLPAGSAIGASPLSTATYTIRLISSLAIFFGRFLWNGDSLLVTNFYLLITCIADSVRVHTLWRLAKLDPSAGFALPALQIVLMIVSAIAFLFSEFCSSIKSREERKGRRVHVDEPSCGTCATLFLGWLWPLLKYGNKNKLKVDDLMGSVPRPTAAYKLQTNKLDLLDTGFWASAMMQFLGAIFIRLLGAASMLAQPFIINGIVSFLQRGTDSSVGVWLVIAMLFNQLANSLLQANGEQLFLQLAVQIRSFLIHCIALRSFGSTPPEGADWETADGKVLVRLSQDSATISGAVIMSGMIIPNIFVVGVGSYVLFRYINLAFLGPLLAVVACLLAPMLLGGPLSRSQQRFLEAAECRIQIVKNLISEIRNIRFSNMQSIAACQATETRAREIDAATTFRSVLTWVIAISTFTMSLANLAAFGGSALLPRLNLDYAILFTSLSMIQIMVMPLLSIIQMLPEFFSAFVSWKRIRDYVADDTGDGEFTGPPCWSKEEAAGLLLYLAGATAEWATDSPILRDAYLSVSAEDLLVILGTPGCGKSSFLKALLGEAQIKGTVRVGARHLTYCDQLPWFIPEMTIKQNILFGKDFDSVLYAEVVEACCLDHDFTALVNGDETKLASNGSPLSGGQRKRVSLARTLYDADGDLLLLDDIFSGLDAKTRTQLVTKVFGPSGLLQKRRAAAIMCCTEAPPSLSGAANVRFYQLDSGSLTTVEKTSTTTASEKSIEEEIKHSLTPSEIDSSTVKQSANDSEVVVDSNQSIGDTEGTPDHGKGKISRGHRLYLRSLGSLATLLFTALLLFGYVGVDKGSTFWLSHWASQYAHPHESVAAGYYVGVYAAFAAAGLFLSFAMTRMLFMKLMPNSSISLHQDMLNTLVKTPAFAAESEQSETVNRFMNDIEAVDLDLPQALENLVTALGTSLGSLIVIAIGSPYAIISLVALVPLLWLLQKFYLSTSFQLRTLQIAARAPMLEVASATVQGRLTIRALRAETYLSRIISDRVYYALLMGYFFNSIQNWAILMLNLLNGCLATAVAGLLIGLGGSHSAGWGGLALVNTITLGQDSMLLLMWWTRFESSMASMERIFEYTHHTAQETVTLPATAVTETWPETGSITLNNLSLAYTSHIVVDGVTVKIAPGSKVAILGRTGSGKTSLLQAFFGLIRITGGTLQVDGAELTHVDNDIVRRRLVGHPQKFVANSNGTVKENLDPEGDLPRSRIEEVLGQVMSAEMSAEVMSKLDAKWSDCNFSEGWQQHIGICRTLLRNSTVYVLDEPTSGMSDERHEEVMDAMFSITAGETLLTTTHTLVGIKQFNQFMVIQDGRLVEHGSPSEFADKVGSMLYELIRAGARQ